MRKVNIRHADHHRLDHAGTLTLLRDKAGHGPRGARLAIRAGVPGGGDHAQHVRAATGGPTDRAGGERLADRVAVIDAGRIVAEGTPHQLKQDIGAERAVLDFDPGDIDSAWRTLDRSGIVADRQATQVSIQIEAPGQLRDLLNQLDAEGLEPATLSVTRPTLDDVFLNLTETAHRTGGDPDHRHDTSHRTDHRTGQEVA